MELIIVGCQSGDEGKGKFTDVFGADAYAVVRYQGGPHTGHTVVTQAGEFRFVQLPSGLTRGAIGVLGNGCVIAPKELLAEIRSIEDRLGPVRLIVSEIAHVVLPYHLMQDEAMERWRGEVVATSAGTGLATGTGQLGSTKRGVGPCREDKIARIGIRLIDLLDLDLLRSRFAQVLPLKRALLEQVLEVPADVARSLDPERLAQEFHHYGKLLSPYLGDVSAFLADARKRNEFVVYEGAQSFGLDVEHGTYPFCSSGYSAASGVTVGTGTPPHVPFEIVGVAKAYTASVGGGPLLTELEGDIADHLVERGREHGTVTGRRRRVGWLDLPSLRRAIRVDGIKYLCLSNLDVLAGLPEVKVATHYTMSGSVVQEYPVSLSEAARCQPVFRKFDGWGEQDWTAIARRGLGALPEAARRYLDFVCTSLGVQLMAVGIGPQRDQTIVVDTGLRGLRSP